MAYYGTILATVGDNIGVPSIIMQHLAEVQYMILRHREGKEVADYFDQCLHPLSCCPEHREALDEALSYARMKSLFQQTSETTMGRGPGGSGINKVHLNYVGEKGE